MNFSTTPDGPIDESTTILADGPNAITSDEPIAILADGPNSILSDGPNAIPLAESTDILANGSTNPITVVFRLITGICVAVYGTDNDIFYNLLVGAVRRLGCGECTAYLNGVAATAETLDKSAKELKLHEYNCIFTVPIKKLTNLPPLNLDPNQLTTLPTTY